MYQNFKLEIFSNENLNNYKFVNVKIPLEYLLNNSTSDVYDLLYNYCPKDDDDNIQLTNLFITSENDNEKFKYYYYNSNIYVRCTSLEWVNDNDIYKAKIRINLLAESENEMDNNLLLFKDDLIEFTNDESSAFYVDFTDPYYSILDNNHINCSFMQSFDGETGIREYPPQFERISKFDGINSKLYYIKEDNTWIEEPFQNTYVKYIIDFTKLTGISNDIVNAKALDIYSEYKYLNSSSDNKTHYCGIIDNSDHGDCDFKTLINFNASNTLSIGEDKTAIIYSNKISSNSEEDLDINSYYDTMSQSIGDTHSSLIKYDNYNLSVIDDNTLNRYWDKQNGGCE